MDQELMQKALQSVLGEGYQAQSRTTGGNTMRSPSPHDYFRSQVSKDVEGVDLHVQTSMGTQKPRTQTPRPKGTKGKLVAVNKAMFNQQGPSPVERKIGRGLTALGGVAGVAGLAAMSHDLPGKMAAAGKVTEDVKAGVSGAKTLGSSVKDAYGGASGFMKPIKALGAMKDHPVGALRLHQGAMGLEAAALGGDVIANRAMKQPSPPKQPRMGVMKRLEPEQITFSKVDSEKKQVFGWCSVSKKDGVDVVDLQGDLVPIDEIEKSAYDYMLMSRKAGNQHERHDEYTPRHVGDVIESMVFTPEKIEKMGLPEDFPQGWWLGMKIHDDETWAQIKSGERAGFSIHGKGRREAVVEKTLEKKMADRKEQAKDITLGAAGATSASAGAGSAVIPKMAEKGKLFKDAEKAEKLSGKLKVVGATVGGAAGVYGGLHAIHVAAKQPPIKTVKKAWTPTVQRDTLEEARMKRNQRQEGYIRAGVGVAGVNAVRHGVQAGFPGKESREMTRAANTARAAKKKSSGYVEMARTSAKANRVAHLKGAGRSAGVALAAEGAAELIRHKRQGSWRPYPHVQ